MGIHEVIARLGPHWHTNPRVESVDEFDPVERRLGIWLPADYKAVMMWSNGGEGNLPGGHLQIWHLAQLPQQGRVEELPHLLVFGGDGGDHAFAWDSSSMRETGIYRVVEFPLNDRDPEAVEVVADHFEEFLRHRLEAK
jgi:hypothetical protein